MFKKLKGISIGFGLCPFWWQLKNVSDDALHPMLAFGPFRIGWRGIKPHD